MAWMTPADFRDSRRFPNFQLIYQMLSVNNDPHKGKTSESTDLRLFLLSSDKRYTRSAKLCASTHVAFFSFLFGVPIHVHFSFRLAFLLAFMHNAREILLRRQ
jgi:hypothetical protein